MPTTPSTPTYQTSATGSLWHPDEEGWERWADSEMENRRDRAEQDDPHAGQPFSRFATW